MKLIVNFLLITSTCLFPCFAQAAKLSPLITSAVEFGGDKLLNVTYSDGSKSNIEAGRGIILGGGINIDLSETKPHTFEAQATLAVKWTSAKQASNGEVDWYRFPLEILSFYRNTDKNFRIGAGVTYQFSNRLKGSKSASAVSKTFDNSTGLILEGDYFVSMEKNFTVGLRYTAINYRPQGSSTTPISGNSFGINLSYFWL